MSETTKFERFTLKEFRDSRGALMPLEFKDYVDWDVKRVYWAYDTQETRGSHAHKEEHELFVCMKGSIKARLHDGEEWHEFDMKPGDGIHVPAMIWHEFADFSDDAILLAASSINYDRSGYVENFNEFIELVSKI